MKLTRCPVCHSDIHLDQLLEDEAGRELLSLIAKLTHNCARPMVSYIGLFRPAKSALSNSRACKLINEVLGMYNCSLLLAHALGETAEAIRRKRLDMNNLAPLTNHNYLKQVYESQSVNFVASAPGTEEPKGQKAEVRQVEDRKNNNILYIDNMRRMGQDISKLPGYEDWLEAQSNNKKNEKPDIHQLVDEFVNSEWTYPENYEEEK